MGAGLRPAPHPPLGRRSPLRRGVAALSIAWLAYLVEPLSGTGLDFSSAMVLLCLAGVVGAASLAETLTRRPLSRGRLLAWLAHPLAVAALLGLFLASQSPANPLFALRVRLSRPALEAAARSALAGAPPATPAWVGLFPVRRIDADPHEIRLMSAGCGVIDECGLLYRPGPLPGGRSKTRLKPLGGPWYHLYAVF